MVAGVALFALMGFSLFNAGVGSQSAAMAGALAGNSTKAEVAFSQAIVASGPALVDFDATVTAGVAKPGQSGAFAFTQGFATGVIENLIADINALASPVETALALAELGRLLATDTVNTVELLYEELVASQIDTLINGTDYERGRVLGSQVSPVKALSVLAKASGASVLAGIAKRAEQTDRDPNARPVFRALSKDDDPSKGLTARNPDASATPAQHVNGKRDSQFISTTKDEATAREKFNSGNGVVEIDLNKVEGNVVDVSDGVPNGSQKVNNFARKDQEVLIEGRVPPEAIRVIEEPR